MRTKTNATVYALAACASVVLLAGCASKVDPVSVTAANPGGPIVSASASSSASPTRPAKPTAERLPDSAVLTAVLQVEPASSSSAKSAARTAAITNAKTVAEIAADLNALPTLPHYTGIVHCPMESVGSVLVLDFRDSAAGRVLAEVQLTPRPSGQCAGGVEVTVGGVTQPRLDDSGTADFFTRIEQLAGLTSS